MNELQHLEINLSGINLIEADAGTGKTYAIVCLYLRLLLEQNLSPEQILVVTFTDAATKELKGRIRDKLREALGAFETGTAADDFLQKLFQRYEHQRQHICHKLELALAAFDTASIFTIHGFCLRALQDHTFLTNSRFESTLVTDPIPDYTAIVQDFWRIHLFTSTDGLVAAATQSKISVESLTDFIKTVMLNPVCQVEPRFNEQEIAAIKTKGCSLYAQLQDSWLQRRDELTALLNDHKGLRRNEKAYRQDQLPPLFAAMDSYCANGQPWAIFNTFNLFCSGFMRENQLKKVAPPQDSFFDLAEQMAQLVEQRLLAFKAELYQYCLKELASRKEKQNICFFDDLLTRLHDGLHQENSEELIKALQSQFQAVLIDEFQDTDPLQYGIFKKIYSNSKLPLFLIGDPKQAIYSFRGADIFAYLQAVHDTDPSCHFTLNTNRRSTPLLLKAFNTIFQSQPEPFIYPEINYTEAKPAPDWSTDELVLESDATPLQLWYLPQREKSYSVEEINRWAAESTAAEIADLLIQAGENKATLNERSLQPGDIAVIVRTNRQGQLVRSKLQELAIPSVMRSDATVFDTEEAAELAILMQAIISPNNEPLLRAALVTDLLGKTAHELAVLLEDEAVWEEQLLRFNSYHILWQDKGFMVMARQLLTREQVRSRLLAFGDGERRLTNLLHLMELIHEAAHQENLGMEAATAWFTEKITAKDNGDEYQQRLETDDALVRIVTIHMSKGLEYPVVFNPFLWDGGEKKQDVISLHEQSKLIRDFGSLKYNERSKEAEREQRAENLRLFYVALTRARCRCYLLAAPLKPGLRHDRTPLNLLLDTKAGNSFEQQMQELASSSGGSVKACCHSLEVQHPPKPLATTDRVMQQPVCRQMKRQLNDHWRVTSFTALASADFKQPEQPDRDEQQKPIPPYDGEPERFDIFGFPRGAKTGLFFHELLEKMNFARLDQGQIQSDTAQLLEKYGFGEQWLPVITKQIEVLLKTQFLSPEGSFTLNDLATGSWLVEMEFFFPLRFIRSEQLVGLLQKRAGFKTDLDVNSLAAKLGFKPVQGMVRGFIDLIFRHNGRYYLLDWKSNHLGYKVEDYQTEAVLREMEHHLYPLQYLLYTVALHHYLKLRLRDYDYDQHFGGVIYLFLRGVSVEDNRCGLYQDRPSRQLIEALSALLVDLQGESL